MIIPISYFNLSDGRDANIVTRVQKLYSNGETSITVQELEKSYTNTPESQLQMIQDVSHYFELVGTPTTVASEPAVVSQQQVANSDKGPYSLSVAAILCFFFGNLGVHRFYTGKIGSGIAMLSLVFLNAYCILVASISPYGFSYFYFLCGFVGVTWALVDFVVILCGKFKDGNGRTLTY